MTAIRARSRLVVTLAALLLLGASCAGDEGGSQAGGDGTTTNVTGPTPTGGTGAGGRYGTGSGNDGSGGGGGAGEASATIQANNFQFAPAGLKVEAGSEIEVKNGNASTPHTFTVEGTDIDVELSPLDSVNVTIDLDPGKYDFFCRFHSQMTGTLTVT